MLKRQQFKDSGCDKIKPRGSKCQQLYIHDNKEGKGLDKFEDEGKRKDIRYILLLFVAPFQKESNYLIDMGKRTKSLNYLICIPKIG